MDRHYFNPTPDMIYTNKGGGSYICLEGGSRLSDVRGRHNRVGQLHRRILRGMIPHKWDFKSHISSKEIAKYETELYRQKSFFRYNR